MDEEFHILIVDDEPNIRSGLAKGLEKEASHIETAGTVNETLDKFDAGSFQLVIADVRLPGAVMAWNLYRSSNNGSPA